MKNVTVFEYIHKDKTKIIFMLIVADGSFTNICRVSFIIRTGKYIHHTQDVCNTNVQWI